MPHLSAIRADITKLNVDAIVNAANSTLLGGGGVDGSIHRAAGPELRKECQLLGGCEAGNAKITYSYQLPSKYVIHTVGPVWQGGSTKEKNTLASCYQKCLEIALEYNCKNIAFPCISTGIYGYPVELAAQVAITTVHNFFDSIKYDIAMQEVIFVCFSGSDQNIYKDFLEWY